MPGQSRATPGRRPESAGMRPRRRVPSTRSHRDTTTFDAYVDRVVLAIARVRRMVGQQVVGAVLSDDPVESTANVVAVHHREPAAVLGEHGQLIGCRLERARLTHVDGVDVHVRTANPAGRTEFKGELLWLVHEPIAHEDHGLLAPGDAVEPSGHLADRRHHALRAENGLRASSRREDRLADTADGWANRLRQRPFRDFLTDELVDRCDEQPLVARELLGRLTQVREHDGHEVVRAEMLLDEPPRGVLGASGPVPTGTVIVQDHHEDAAVERAFVALDVRRNRDQRRARLGGGVDGKVHERKRRYGLRLAIFEDLKIIFRQISNEVAVGVGHPRVHLDVLDLQPERGRLGLC